MPPSWGASWSWGLSLIALTIMAHALGVVFVALGLERTERRAKQVATTHWREITIAATIFGGVGLLLAILHGLEAVIWALAYIGLDAMPSFHEAILFSVDCMTTRGAVGADLTAKWQLMGALEAADGMLLFGISTAFLFAVLERVLPLLRRRRHRPP